MNNNSLQGELQDRLQTLLNSTSYTLEGGLQGYCDRIGIAAGHQFARLIPAAQQFDTGVGTASGALNLFLQNPGYIPTMYQDFTTGSLGDRVTFTRASSGTRFDSTGTLVTMATDAARFDYDPGQYYPNLLTYPESFDNAVWVKNASATVSANGLTAPNGLASADTVTSSAAINSGVWYNGGVTIASGVTCTFSLYIKNVADATSLRIGSDGTPANGYVTFNAATGAITASAASVVSSSVQPVGSGWYRVAITVVTTSAAYIPVVYSMTGSVASWGVWGAKLETGSVATTYDNQGLAYQNLFQYSQDFATSYWGAIDATLISGIIDPLRGTTAQFMREAAGASVGTRLPIGVTLTVGNVYTASIYAKENPSSAKRYLHIYYNAGFGGTLGAVFDLATGTVTGVSTGFVAYTISAGNGWYRCVLVSSTATTSSGGFRYRLNSSSSISDLAANYVGDGTSGMYIWGAQQNLGNSPLPYYATTTSAYTQCQPRGLLVEEARTNSIRNNTMAGAVAGSPGTLPTNWSSSSTGLTRTVVGTGTSNGIAYVDIRFNGVTAATFGSLYFESSTGITASSGQVWTASAYISVVGGSTTNITNLRYAVDENTGAGAYLATQTGSSLLASVTAPLSRYSSTFTLANASTGAVTPYISMSWASGAAIDITLRVGLPQMEQGAFATSVISTSSAAATRAADVASMTGTNFSAWYSATEGTVYGQWQSFGTTAGTSGILSIGDATKAFGAAETLYLSRSNSTNAVSATVITGGVSQANLAPGTQQNIVGNAAFAYKANDFAASLNGAAVVTDTSGTVPTPTSMSIGSLNSGWTSAGNYTNGWIRKIAYYPTRLSNTILQSLTT